MFPTKVATRHVASSAPQRVSFNIFGRAIGVCDPTQKILPGILDCLPPGVSVSPWRGLDRIYQVTRNRCVASGSDLYQLMVGKQTILTSVEPERIVLGWQQDLEMDLSLHAPNKVFVHAGVVAYNGKAIVLPGKSGAGKSTLVAALLNAGAAYYSDEFAVFRPDGQIVPYPRPLRLRSPVAASRPGHLNDLNAGTPRASLPVRLIADLQFSPASNWSWQRISMGEAALALLSHTSLSRVRPEFVLNTLQQALPNAVCIRGSRGEATDAIDKLIELISE